jgi:hypothetical protein
MDQRKLVVDILSNAFLDNPRVLRTVKKGNTERKLRIMTEYAYDLVNKRNGVFLSSDKSTAMLYYRKSEHKMNVSDYWRYFRMFILCIKPTNTLAIQKREKYIESLRPQGIDYIYVWLLGNNPKIKGLKGLAEIRNCLDEKSIEYNLPILIETTVERNLKLYQYVGFETYHHWYDAKEDMNVWFLLREVKVARRNFEKTGRLI